MRWEQDIPVKKTHEPFGAKEGSLDELGFFLRAGVNLELKPSLAGHFHLGSEPNRAPRLQSFDPPEIKRVSNLQFGRFLTTWMSQAGPAEKLINESP